MRIRTESKREEILEIALQVFIEMGFEAGSMSEVAARLGGSKTTLYGYFRSKEQLFLGVMLHVIHDRVAPVLEALSDRLQDDPREVLIDLGMRINEALTRPDTVALAKIAFSQLATPEFAQRYWEAGPLKLFEALSGYLDAQNIAGKLKIDRTKVATEHLIALYRAEFGPPFHPGSRLPPSRRAISLAVHRAVDVFLAAYGRR